MCTSFVRIIVVLSLVRSAIGASALPPNAVLTGTGTRPNAGRHGAYCTANRPRCNRSLLAWKISPSKRDTRNGTITFLHVAADARCRRCSLRTGRAPGAGARAEDADAVLVPAFVVGELRSAFAIGFALYFPFVAIDLAVAAMLMGSGMMMLSPPVVSLPVKLLFSSWSTVGRYSAEASREVFDKQA